MDRNLRLNRLHTLADDIAYAHRVAIIRATGGYLESKHDKAVGVKDTGAAMFAIAMLRAFDPAPEGTSTEDIAHDVREFLIECGFHEDWALDLITEDDPYCEY